MFRNEQRYFIQFRKLLTLRWIIDTEVGWIARSDVPFRSVVVDVSKKLEKLGRQQAIQGRIGVSSNFVTHMKVSLIAILVEITIHVTCVKVCTAC